jgi:hypothetical protein
VVVEDDSRSLDKRGNERGRVVNVVKRQTFHSRLALCLGHLHAAW